MFNDISKMINLNDLKGKTILCFDLETTGFPEYNKNSKNVYFSPTNNSKYDKSRIVQVGWSLIFNFSIDTFEKSHILAYIRKPLDFEINDNDESTHIHKITNTISKSQGYLLSDILNKKGLKNAIMKCDYVLGHNILFDINILMNELCRLKYNLTYDKLKHILDNKKYICTLKISQNLRSNLKFTSAKLGELYKFFYNEEKENLHNAETDVFVTLKIFKKLCENFHICHQNRIYLSVPFTHKDRVKQMGGKYDPENKKWYVIGSTIGFEKYIN